MTNPDLGELSGLDELRAIHARLNAEPTPDRRSSSAASAPRSGHEISLPTPQPVQLPLSTAIRQRRSRYDFDSTAALDLAAVGTLLGTALGLGRRVHAYGNQQHPLSVAPTAGGLASREVFLFATRINGLRPGIYRYDLAQHCLKLVQAADPSAVLDPVYVQPEFAIMPAASLALTARLDVALAKYPLRHYRTVHVDAGIAVQNLYLAATGLGLASCAVSGFSDTALEAVLGLDDQSITVMMMAVGPSRSDLGAT